MQAGQVKDLVLLLFAEDVSTRLIADRAAHRSVQGILIRDGALILSHVIFVELNFLFLG